MTPRRRPAWLLSAILFAAAGALLALDGARVRHEHAVQASSPDRIDFGIVPLGAEPVLCRTTLTYRNAGWRRITLAGTSSSCGCTAVSTGGEIVAPGEALTVEVVMSVSQTGHRDSIVSVLFENGQLFRHELHAIGARASAGRLLSRGERTERGDEGVERLWLLATTEEASPPAPPRVTRGGLLLHVQVWSPLGGSEVGRPPHHWMASLDVRWDPPTTTRRPVRLLDVAGQRVRVE